MYLKSDSMHRSLLLILTTYALWHGVTIFGIPSSIDTPIESIAISCGSSGTPIALDGRIWVGDKTLSSASSLHFLSGKSWASGAQSAQDKASVLIDHVPYQTARTSHHEFSYKFSVKSGQKFIRLHFNPAPYKGFKKSIALFTVKAGPYTLLSNFSPSLTADALGVKFLIKEFSVNVREGEALTITFTPSQDTRDAYAFVNGIEIVSMPTGLYFTPEGNPGAHVVGRNYRFYIDSSTALEMIQRLNIGGHPISSIEDVSMFRDWKDDYSYLLERVGAASIGTTITIKYVGMMIHLAPPKVYQTARSVHPRKQQLNVKNLTWKIPVDLGFRYLVRLHFCEFEPEISATGERQFSILINNQIAEHNADVIEWSGASGIAVYKDYIAMMEGDRMKGEGNLVISLLPNSLSSKRTDGILNGLEIFKLSNPDNCLAGKNPARHAQSSRSEIRHSQRSVSVDRKNAIATALTVIITVLNIVIYYLRCLAEDNSTTRNTRSSSTDQACRQFSLKEIQLSTNDFSPEFLIGIGGYGKVYRGSIDGGATEVAIKRLKEESRQGENEFWTEIKMLSKARNEHLVSLIGFCNEGKEMVLVYEYMPRGTVADHLHKIDRAENGHSPLSWERRLKISIGAAKGLHYLHTSQDKVIHRDVKSSNILLDESWVAKISDFGLSKMGAGNDSFTHVSTDVKGTYGYLDPEYYMTRRLTTKSDVYAFGVVLLEVLTGRPALDRRLIEEQHSLATWAMDYIRKGKVNEIVDCSLAGQVSRTCLKVFVEIVGRCLRKQGHERPDMADVITNLKLVLALQQKEWLQDEDKSIDSDHSDGVISFGDLCGAFSDENMEKITIKMVPYKGEGKGKDNDIHRERAKKDSISKPNASVRWWSFLWFLPKQLSKAKASSTMPRIPKQPSKRKASPTQLQGGIHHFSLREILQATDNFNQSFIIGFGGADKVYIGFLNGGETIVSIRRASTVASIHCMVHELQTKLDNLPLPSHANVVSLIGYCNADAETMLVYNYMANGSLQDHLHDPDKDPLPWKQRLQICINAAHGLCYLQPILKQSILHCEFNSTNILLDENWVAKVSDFGWSKRKHDSHVRGSRYLDSDYDRESIAHWFKSHLRGSLSRCIDPNLVGKISPDCLQMFVDTASSCLHEQGSQRPSLSEIVASLEAALKLQEAADANKGP